MLMEDYIEDITLKTIQVDDVYKTYFDDPINAPLMRNMVVKVSHDVTEAREAHRSFLVAARNITIQRKA